MTHQFITIEQITKPRVKNSESIGLRFEQDYGVKVVCVLCGEIREVWADGDIQIKKGPSKDVVFSSCPNEK